MNDDRHTDEEFKPGGIVESPLERFREEVHAAQLRWVDAVSDDANEAAHLFVAAVLTASHRCDEATKEPS